jgi:hypothetical protein
LLGVTLLRFTAPAAERLVSYDLIKSQYSSSLFA